jgi:hypothetical protein
LALAVVIGSGWISYGTVLSAGAAAAALVVMGAAALVQATLTRNRIGAAAWIAVGGLCVALAATYELTALAFLIFMLLVVGAFRWPAAARIGAIASYALGAAIPILLYVALNKPITGDLLPGFLHPDPIASSVASSVGSASADRSIVLSSTGPLKRTLQDAQAAPTDSFRAGPSGRVKHPLEEDEDPPSFWRNAFHDLSSFAIAFVGGHGLLTHFPVLIVGMLGWPAPRCLRACRS